MAVVVLNLQPVSRSQQSRREGAASQLHQRGRSGAAAGRAAHHLRRGQRSQGIARIGVAITGQQKIAGLRRGADVKRDGVARKRIVDVSVQVQAVQVQLQARRRRRRERQREDRVRSVDRAGGSLRIGEAGINSRGRAAGAGASVHMHAIAEIAGSAVDQPGVVDDRGSSQREPDAFLRRQRQGIGSTPPRPKYRSARFPAPAPPPCRWTPARRECAGTVVLGGTAHTCVNWFTPF